MFSDTTCASCERIAETTVQIEYRRGSLQKDLCGPHLEELLAGARVASPRLLHRPITRRGGVTSRPPRNAGQIEKAQD
jgi:hypothetical protein